jgi:hypothetical protein
VYLRSSHTRRPHYLLTVILLLTLKAPASLAQLSSGPGSIALTARLESLSVSAVPPEDAIGGAGDHNKVHRISVRLTTSWSVPSNLTTIKVVEDGTPIFSQSTGQSSRPGKRLDQLYIERGPDETEGASLENQRRRVIIIVQAL